MADLIIGETLTNRSFEIVQTGVVVLASPNSAGTSTFELVGYGLNYRPTVFAFVAFSSNGTKYPMPYNDVNPLTGSIRFVVSYSMIQNQMNFNFVDITGNNTTAYIRYYLCKEPASNN